jgi:hypothetical protein
LEKKGKEAGRIGARLKAETKELKKKKGNGKEGEMK